LLYPKHVGFPLRPMNPFFDHAECILPAARDVNQNENEDCRYRRSNSKEGRAILSPNLKRRSGCEIRSSIHGKIVASFPLRVSPPLQRVPRNRSAFSEQEWRGCQYDSETAFPTRNSRPRHSDQRNPQRQNLRDHSSLGILPESFFCYNESDWSQG
jgi:hypothetical protein